MSRGRVIAIANAAGSAGKSTTTVSLAALLAGQGQRVLVIDGDAQATATSWLGVSSVGSTTGDVLLRRAALGDAILDTAVGGVRIVPAARGMDADTLTLGSIRGGDQRLRLALEGAALPFDVVLVDCPGAVSTITVAALVAADAVVTVTQPTMKELEGLPELEATIEEVAEAYRPGLRLDAVVPCIVPASNGGALYQAALATLAASYPGRVTSPVRRSARVPESYAAKVSLPLYAPRENVTADYGRVLAELTAWGIL